MALIHQATLRPTKIELLTDWLPGRSWSTGSVFRQLGAYRFDDPLGAVGIEAFLVQAADGSVLHVPLTYRGAPLAGAEEHLVGTTEHSVLGRRWVYDGCADPIWAAALATTILTGGTQVEELVDTGGRLESRPATATVTGSGKAGPAVAPVAAVTAHDEGWTTVIQADGGLRLIVVRVAGVEVWAAHTLTARWSGGGPTVLAAVDD